MHHELGSNSLFPYFAADRPFQAIPEGIAFALFGENPALWHGYAFVLRVFGGWALLWLLRGLWPQQRFATTMAALLFVVYPGFTQQSIGLTYSSHFLTLLLALMSIGLSLRALAAANRGRFLALTVISMLLCAAYLWLLEFAIGLEALRLLLIGYVVVRQGRFPSSFAARVSVLLRLWLPYLLVTATFVIWRVFFFTSARLDTDIGFALSHYTEGSLSSFLSLPLEMGRSFITVTVLAWANIFPLVGVSLSAFWLSLVLATAALTAVLAYGRWVNKQAAQNVQAASASSWARVALVVGVLSVFAALLLPVVVDRNPVLNDAYDRYTLPAMAGAVLIVVGCAYTFLKTGRALLLAAMIALAVMVQFHAGNTYRAHWDVQQAMWWQFMWRVPDLEPGTVLITNAAEPTNLVPIASHTIYGPANILYAPSAAEPQFGGFHFYANWASNVLDGLQTGADFVGGWRSIPFESSFRNSLIVYYDGLSCLRVIDGQRLELPAAGILLLDGIALYSQIDQIYTGDTEPLSPPEALFGPEPPHTWCYYFQSADLARQRGDWDEVARLGDEAREQGFSALDASEWLVFIEGYLNVGRIDTAREISHQIVNDSDSSFILFDVCALLDRVASGENDANTIEAELGCGALR